jgi:imidazolonepropionase-like amidohydrolase
MKARLGVLIVDESTASITDGGMRVKLAQSRESNVLLPKQAGAGDNYDMQWSRQARSATRVVAMIAGTYSFAAAMEGIRAASASPIRAEIISLQERAKWVSAATPVSDDPRRVPVSPGPRGPEGSVVLRGGRVFDGTGTAVRPGTVVIERNRITAVLAPGSSQWPANARVIDVAGKTVMPGLIDLHTHLTYTEPGTPDEQATEGASAALRGVERLRFYAESGITSVRDVASVGTAPFRLKQWVAENRIPGPRVFAAGELITGTGGHGAEGDWHVGCPLRERDGVREASGPNDWREAVREQFKRGADLIKLASHYTREEVAAAVDEAHTLGLKVTVDAETFYIQWAVEAGADTIEHPLPRSEETIQLMARKGTASVPTLVPYIYIFDLAGGYYGSTSRRFDFSKEANFEMLRKLKRAGIKLGVGTDLVTDWFRYLPQAYITELKQFVAAGFTTEQALMAATKTSAEILGMEDKLGTLAPGKLADVIVVDGQPDRQLEDLGKVSLVVRDGHVILENGRVVIAPHVPVPEPDPKKTVPGREW